MPPDTVNLTLSEEHFLKAYHAGHYKSPLMVSLLFPAAFCANSQPNTTLQMHILSHHLLGCAFCNFASHNILQSIQ